MNYSSELQHHGIKGQKWGIRRYQNPDGTLTPEGVKRYGRKVRQGRKSLFTGAALTAGGAFCATLGGMSLNPLLTGVGVALSTAATFCNLYGGVKIKSGSKGLMIDAEARTKDTTNATAVTRKEELFDEVAKNLSSSEKKKFEQDYDMLFDMAENRSIASGKSILDTKTMTKNIEHLRTEYNKIDHKEISKFIDSFSAEDKKALVDEAYNKLHKIEEKLKKETDMKKRDNLERNERDYNVQLNKALYDKIDEYNKTQYPDDRIRYSKEFLYIFD